MVMRSEGGKVTAICTHDADVDYKIPKKPKKQQGKNRKKKVAICFVRRLTSLRPLRYATTSYPTPLYTCTSPTPPKYGLNPPSLPPLPFTPPPPALPWWAASHWQCTGIDDIVCGVGGDETEETEETETEETGNGCGEMLEEIESGVMRSLSTGERRESCGCVCGYDE